MSDFHSDGPGGWADGIHPGSNSLWELPDHDASICGTSVSMSKGYPESEPLTPALVLGLRDTARERRGVHVSVACVAGLADDEHVQRDAGGRDLEKRSVRPGRARGVKQAGADGVLGGVFCGGVRERMITGNVGLDSRS